MYTVFYIDRGDCFGKQEFSSWDAMSSFCNQAKRSGSVITQVLNPEGKEIKLFN